MRPGSTIANTAQRKDSPKSNSHIRIGENGDQGLYRNFRVEIGQGLRRLFSHRNRSVRVDQYTKQRFGGSIARVRNPAQRAGCGMASILVRAVESLNQRAHGAPVAEVL